MSYWFGMNDTKVDVMQCWSRTRRFSILGHCAIDLWIYGAKVRSGSRHVLLDSESWPELAFRSAVGNDISHSG